jgi:hypothetical protein
LWNKIGLTNDQLLTLLAGLILFSIMRMLKVVPAHEPETGLPFQSAETTRTRAFLNPLSIWNVIPRTADRLFSVGMCFLGLVTPPDEMVLISCLVSLSRRYGV